jgi:hypothetical protein
MGLTSGHRILAHRLQNQRQERNQSSGLAHLHAKPQHSPTLETHITQNISWTLTSSRAEAASSKCVFLTETWVTDRLPKPGQETLLPLSAEVIMCHKVYKSWQCCASCLHEVELALKWSLHLQYIQNPDLNGNVFSKFHTCKSWIARLLPIQTPQPLRAPRGDQLPMVKSKNQGQ